MRLEDMQFLRKGLNVPNKGDDMSVTVNGDGECGLAYIELPEVER